MSAAVRREAATKRWKLVEITTGAAVFGSLILVGSWAGGVSSAPGLVLYVLAVGFPPLLLGLARILSQRSAAREPRLQDKD